MFSAAPRPKRPATWVFAIVWVCALIPALLLRCRMVAAGSRDTEQRLLRAELRASNPGFE
jgi:hypothetical protein